jgi:tetratricopeptide (TPR) repeat protein
LRSIGKGEDSPCRTPDSTIPQPFLRPPGAVEQHLKAAYVRGVEHAVENNCNTAALLKYSGILKKLGYLDLALRIGERVLVTEPRNGFAIARVSSILRAKGEPEQALNVTSRLPENQQGHAVLTTRAAALCDLGHLPEAMRTIRRALALLQSCPKIEATEALSVYGRIRSLMAKTTAPSGRRASRN